MTLVWYDYIFYPYFMTGSRYTSEDHTVSRITGIFSGTLLLAWVQTWTLLKLNEAFKVFEPFLEKVDGQLNPYLLHIHLGLPAILSAVQIVFYLRKRRYDFIAEQYMWFDSKTKKTIWWLTLIYVVLLVVL